MADIGTIPSVSHVATMANNYTVDPQSPIGEYYNLEGGQNAFGSAMSNSQMMPDGIGSYQAFEKAALFYSPTYGVVSVISPIYQKWLMLLNDSTPEGGSVRDYLGYPTANTFNTPNRGQAVTFEGGMIVLLSTQKAFVTYGPVYARYQLLDGVFGFLGLPTADEQNAANNGRFSSFDQGDIYWCSANGAYEVHGDIRTRWLALGGAGGVLGYPLSNETPVLLGSHEVGRFNQFQGGSIYWSASTGAWEVQGDIRKAWLEKYGGPTGQLGFPTSNETPTPSNNGRYNNFEKGVILWRGNYNSMFAITSLDIYLESFDSKGTHTFAEAHLGANIWLYVNMNITSSTGEHNQQRMPASGNWGVSSHNVQQSMLSVPVVHGNTVVTASFDGWDAVEIGSDCHLGTAVETFNIDNLWGLNQDPNHWNGDFNALFSCRPHVLTDPTASFRESLYWAFRNFSTPTLTWSQFCQTFSDVSENDNNDYFLHPFDNAYYSWVYKTIAGNGNCFGMCLASIYAQVGHEVYGEPIFTVPPTNGSEPNPTHDAGLINEVNIKHGYQVGAECVDFFVTKFISGQTHDPVRAFNESRDQFGAGNYPILSLSNDAVFSEAHAVRPYFWDSTDPNRWVMHVANPNNPAPGAADTAPPCMIVVNPKTNTFSFQFSNTENWVGTSNSGGRMFSIPFNVLCVQPRTPFIEFIIALLTGGVLLALMGGAETQQISDQNGRTFLEPEDTNQLNQVAAQLGVKEGVYLPKKRVVTNDSQRVPNLAKLPFIDETNKIQADPALLSFAGNLHLVETVSKRGEVYYLRQNAPTSRQKTPRTGMSAPSIGPMISKATSAASVANSAMAKAPGVSVTSAMLNPEMIAGNVTSLTHTITPPESGQAYQWAMVSPTFSAFVTIPAAGAQDIVTLENPSMPNQTLTIQTPNGSTPKTLQITLIGAPSILGSSPMRQFQMSNVNIPSGQALRLHVADGGQSLHVENGANPVTFDLSMQTSNEQKAVVTLQKTNVSIDAKQVLSFSPVSWQPAVLNTTPVQVEQMDQLGGSKVLNTRQI